MSRTIRRQTFCSQIATGTALEIGFTSGVAYGEGGRARSGMGADSADFNQDGWMDLFVTNLDHELYSMYQNKHDETFEDKAVSTGIAAATELMSGWGVKFFDYDNDGNLDLLIANGHWDFPHRGA